MHTLTTTCKVKVLQLPVLFMQPQWGATAGGLESADAGKITLEIIVMCVSTELNFLKPGFLKILADHRSSTL